MVSIKISYLDFNFPVINMAEYPLIGLKAIWLSSYEVYVRVFCLFSYWFLGVIYVFRVGVFVAYISCKCLLPCSLFTLWTIYFFSTEVFNMWGLCWGFCCVILCYLNNWLYVFCSFFLFLQDFLGQGSAIFSYKG